MKNILHFPGFQLKCNYIYTLIHQETEKTNSSDRMDDAGKHCHGILSGIRMQCIKYGVPLGQN